MASRAVPKTSVMPAYLFYENGQGFHFRSMDSFFFQVKSEGVAPHPEMFEYFCDSESTRAFANPQDNPMSQLRVVKSHTLVGTNDLIKNQRMGTFASKLITHDAYNKTYNEYKYNYIDEYSSLPHLEKDDVLSDSALYRGLIAKAHYDFNDLETSNRTRGSAYKYLSDYADARIMVQSNTAKIHNTNSDQGFRVNEYLQKRKSALNLFNTIEMELEVNGNTHLNIGHVIRINVPRTGPGKDDTKTSQNDKYLTGRWLITAIRHSFDLATHQHRMILTCSKETFGSNLQEKISPLVLDVTDEGNPINLYDQTEYN